MADAALHSQEEAGASSAATPLLGDHAPANAGQPSRQAHPPGAAKLRVPPAPHAQWASAPAADHDLAARQLHSGAYAIAGALPVVRSAAGVRARAQYFTAVLFAAGLLIALLALLHESYQWRQLVARESEAWRGFVKELGHDIGFYRR